MVLPEFTVFVIDDDQSVLRALVRFLRTAGYEAKAYSSPQAFLDDYDPSMPGCVVLDLSMPSMGWGWPFSVSLFRGGSRGRLSFSAEEEQFPRA